MGINEALGAAGAGVKMTLTDGQELTLMPMTQKTKAEYEAWCQAKAWSTVKASKAHLDKPDYDALLTRTSAAIASGAYSFGGTLFFEMLNQLPGAVKMFHLLLLPKQPGLKEEDVTGLLFKVNQEELGSAMRQLVPELAGVQGDLQVTDLLEGREGN